MDERVLIAVAIFFFAIAIICGTAAVAEWRYQRHQKSSHNQYKFTERGTP